MRGLWGRQARGVGLLLRTRTCVLKLHLLQKALSTTRDTQGRCHLVPLTDTRVGPASAEIRPG